MVAHEKRNSAQLFCAVPTRNDLALSSLIFSAQPTQKLGYPSFHRVIVLLCVHKILLFTGALCIDQDLNRVLCCPEQHLVSFLIIWHDVHLQIKNRTKRSKCK